MHRRHGKDDDARQEHEGDRRMICRENVVHRTPVTPKTARAKTPAPRKLHPRSRTRETKGGSPQRRAFALRRIASRRGRSRSAIRRRRRPQACTDPTTAGDRPRSRSTSTPSALRRILGEPADGADVRAETRVARVHGKPRGHQGVENGRAPLERERTGPADTGLPTVALDTEMVTVTTSPIGSRRGRFRRLPARSGRHDRLRSALNEPA